MKLSNNVPQRLGLLGLLTFCVLLAGCQTIAGGGKIFALGAGEGAAVSTKISTDLDLDDFSALAAEVSEAMLSNERIFKAHHELKISIGAVRNLTENERIRASDIVDLIKESLLKDQRVRLFGSGESFYVIHTSLKSITAAQEGMKAVDYLLTFELYNYETNEFLGTWNAKKSYIQTARSVF